jgi:hypothetical protein
MIKKKRQIKVNKEREGGKRWSENVNINKKKMNHEIA